MTIFSLKAFVGHYVASCQEDVRVQRQPRFCINVTPNSRMICVPLYGVGEVRGEGVGSRGWGVGEGGRE